MEHIEPLPLPRLGAPACPVARWTIRLAAAWKRALGVKRLAGLELPAGAPSDAAARRDRLVALLIADALRFELDAANGRTALQPELRPDARVTEKRCRHALLVLAPVLARRETSITIAGEDPVAAAHAAVEALLGGATADEERMLQLTLLPVSRVHDECLFIRVLQSYETTFAYAAIGLEAAAAAIARGDGTAAVAALGGSEVAADASRRRRPDAGRSPRHRRHGGADVPRERNDDSGIYATLPPGRRHARRPDRLPLGPRPHVASFGAAR